MIIFKEESQPIVEMGQFKGFGIIIEVRSDDHGKFGSKQLPAHAHILDNSGRELAQIELTKEMPRNSSGIVWYKTPNPPDGLGTKIAKLADMESTAAKKAGIKSTVTVWQNVLNQWLIFHEE